jgi:biotin operon repressor
MARRRTGVKKARDIVRYGMTTALSERQIARALGVSRTVVARTIRTFKASGLEHPAIDSMPDSQLIQALAGEEIPKASARYQELSQRFPT